MSLLEAILIGIIQGLTEFLPVSSSGHIELSKAVFGIKLEEGLLFTVVLHAATALSTLVVFRKDIADLFKGLFQFKWNEETRLCWMIVITMIPAAIVGLFWEEHIDNFFGKNVLLVGAMLLVTGAILLISDRAKNASEQEGGITSRRATILGFVQALAIIPGISRSGSTIAAGVLLGMSRARAARFSFIMVLPLIAGVSLKKLLEYASAESGVDASLPLSHLSVSFVAAFISGLFAIRWMIKLVENSQLKWFAYYCFLAGAVSIGYVQFFS